jgi:glycerol-3-phosphate cytidylyltransferase
MTKDVKLKTRKKKYDIVYTTGAFDPFHYGHLNIIKKSKKIAKTLIVGVSTDKLIRKSKGNDPLLPFKKRIAIIESLRYVDKAIPQVDKNKQKIVNKYNIEAITVGSDWKGRYPKVSCKIIYFPYTNEISSTIIKKKLIKKYKK